jgi:hypothetical protein
MVADAYRPPSCVDAFKPGGKLVMTGCSNADCRADCAFADSMAFREKPPELMRPGLAGDT